MKLCLLVGTRPDIIKMSPLIRECERKKLDYFVLHTGQHYSYNMDKLFFEELALSPPKYNLGVGESGTRYQVRDMIEKMIHILSDEKPDIFVIYGDTNSALSGALAANRLRIDIAHVEAGLRSFDIVMAEEVNRMIADHLSKFLFAPTKESKKNLLDEGISSKKIFVVGNTIVDAVRQGLGIAKHSSKIVKKLELKKGGYFLVTAHRPETVDFEDRLEKIFEGFQAVYRKFKLPLIFPVHPRTKKMAKKFRLKFPKGVRAIEPVGFLDFLKLEANAKLLITDSGGVQEEGCILGIPCITIRENTERPETIRVGSNTLTGVEAKKILNSVQKMLKRKKRWKNPYGDGTAGKKILDIIVSQ